jgi:hypothetical protein
MFSINKLIEVYQWVGKEIKKKDWLVRSWNYSGQEASEELVYTQIVLVITKGWKYIMYVYWIFLSVDFFGLAILERFYVWGTQRVSTSSTKSYVLMCWCFYASLCGWYIYLLHNLIHNWYCECWGLNFASQIGIRAKYTLFGFTFWVWSVS